MFIPHYVSCVMCHRSYVMCHESPVTCHLSPVTCHLSHVFFSFLSIIFFDKVVELVGGESVIKGAYPVQFNLLILFLPCPGHFISCLFLGFTQPLYFKYLYTSLFFIRSVKGSLPQPIYSLKNGHNSHKKTESKGLKKNPKTFANMAILCFCVVYFCSLNNVYFHSLKLQKNSD